MKRLLAAAMLVGYLGIVPLVPEPPPPPPPPTEWAEVGELAEPRAYARYLVLMTGEVLMDGGMGDHGMAYLPDRAAVYDPDTRLVRYAQPSVGRMWHTLTELPDGLVMAAGGLQRQDGEWIRSRRVELFDPVTLRWTPVAPLRQGRSEHAAVLLADGRVMVAGGTKGGTPLSSVEIYDPESGRWSAAADMPGARQRLTLAALPDGRVIAVGGREDYRLTRTSAIWDPETGEWSRGPNTALERSLHAAVSLPSGDLLLIGGERAASGTAERYDARWDRFVFAGTLATPRVVASAVALPDGRVVLGGGITLPILGTFAITPSVEVWSPETNTWAALPSLSVGRAQGALVTTDAGVFFIGGILADQHPSHLIELLR